MSNAFFDNGQVLLRTLVVGLSAYLFLILALRSSGKRTLSKMNAFDFVITVSLGSTLASILISKDVSLAQGALALSLLIALQFVITWLSVRFGWVRRVVTGEPTLLLARGHFRPEALKRTRVAEDEVRAAVRSAGVGSLDAVAAVVLETDGTFSVVRTAHAGNASALKDLDFPPDNGT